MKVYAPISAAEIWDAWFHRDYYDARLEHMLMCRAEGMTYAETGDRLGISRKTVGLLMKKASHRLARAMRKTRFTVTTHADQT